MGFSLTPRAGVHGNTPYQAQEFHITILANPGIQARFLPSRLVQFLHHITAVNWYHRCAEPSRLEFGLNTPYPTQDQPSPPGGFEIDSRIGAATPRAPTVSKEVSRPQAILKFRPPSPPWTSDRNRVKGNSQFNLFHHRSFCYWHFVFLIRLNISLKEMERQAYL